MNAKKRITNYITNSIFYVFSLHSDDLCTYAENSYSLEATVMPEDADDQTVDYFIAWANASSTWASGKKVTDYYAIAQTSDGSKTATLTCKQPAGEQAIVTVVSRSTPQAKAIILRHTD